MSNINLELTKNLAERFRDIGGLPDEVAKLASWARRAHAELTTVICERDDGAPTERNLKTAALLAEIETEGV